jgi:hypothetical protein
MKTTSENPFTVARWTRSTFWGWLAGVALIIALSSLLDSMGIEHMQFYLGLGMGLGVGLTQWFFLKKFIAVNKNWIVFSALGLGIPFFVLDLILTGTSTYKIPAGVALGAITVGLLQFLILKSHSPKAGLWIVSCPVGWALAVMTVFTIDYTKHLTSFISSNLLLAFINLLLILAGGIVLGIITGLSLKKILETIPAWTTKLPGS